MLNTAPSTLKPCSVEGKRIQSALFTPGNLIVDGAVKDIAGLVEGMKRGRFANLNVAGQVTGRRRSFKVSLFAKCPRKGPIWGHFT